MLVLFETCALTHERIEDLLADAELGGGDFKELVGVDEVECLLKG